MIGSIEFSSSSPPSWMVCCGSRLGHSGFVGAISGLLESGHGWTIYEYTPQVKRTGGFTVRCSRIDRDWAYWAGQERLSANADLEEYSNCCRRSPERLVGVQLRGGLWGMDRRAHSRPVDCCSSRLHSSGLFCPAHRFGVEARCVICQMVLDSIGCDSTACGQIPSGFLGQKYFEVTAIHKDIGWPGQPRAGGHPQGGRPSVGRTLPPQRGSCSSRAR